MKTGAVWVAIHLALATMDAGASSLAIEVDSEQNLTISGTSPSLREAIAEICERAGVDLVAYEAEDREFSASYTRIPLSDAFARLLRSEIFLIGLRPSALTSGTAVTWLRVSGSKGAVAGGMSTSASRAAAGSIDLGVAPEIIEATLTSDDAIVRNNARRTLLEALRGNRAPLERFLETDITTLVDQIERFPHAAEFLNGLQSVTSNVQQRTQIQTIIRSLRIRQDANRRKAASGVD